MTLHVGIIHGTVFEEAVGRPPGKGKVMPGEHYASGNWRVKVGSEQEFIALWGNWVGKNTGTTAGFGSARLLQDAADAQHFLSFSDWADGASRDAWRASPDFAAGLAALRELCDDFQTGDYSPVGGV